MHIFEWPVARSGCRHFYVFKSFFIQCNYLLARHADIRCSTLSLCIQIHVCHVGGTHVRTNRLFLIPRTNINYSQTIRAEYRKYLFIRSTGARCSALTLIKLRAPSERFVLAPPVARYFFNKIHLPGEPCNRLRVYGLR